jgi:alginate O-acetyltransferase complex protein AlgI
VDVYRGRTAPQEHFLTLLLFSSLFHQCIAGPIIRYDQIGAELSDRHATTADISSGIYRFSLGLAKKAVLANGCAKLADTLLAAESLSSSAVTGLWLGMLCYILQIYLDFSAYSDMAIGMGLMMGFHFPENFNYPYMSKSVKEFWSRWHMTLGTFFRDYVYIPLGGNRVSPLRWLINMLVVWALTGLWHGAHLNYLFWGLYSFLFLVLEKMVLSRLLKRLPKLVRHLYALLVIYFSFVIFKFSDLSQLGLTFKGLLGLNHNNFTDLSTKLLLRNNIFFLVFCCLACTPLYRTIHEWATRHFTRNGAPGYPVLIWNALLPLICLILSMMALVGNSYNPFLYFQF